MKKHATLYLDDILDSIRLIEEYIGKISELQFSRDTQLQDAVIRRLVIIGEAAGKVPPEIQTLAMDVPWRTIVGFRNVAIHDYASVHMGRVWEIIQTELPVLQKQVKELHKKISRTQ